jgi:hypothetical protein
LLIFRTAFIPFFAGEITHSNMLKRILTLLVLALLAGPFLNAQVTTSSITGTVKTGTGEGLTGATVTATHVPTGTVYRTLVRSNGQYTISNLQPGGPYRIVTTFVGYQSDTKEDVFVDLGEVFKADVVLSNQSSALTTVVVATNRAAIKSGTETILNRERIENLPTVGRTLTDYLRNTPQMRISSGGNISSEGAMSFAGQNVRFNSFYIDGAVNNDVFGLAYSGTNGGQSGIAPISIDAIDQFQVSISPYNASLGNFTGAAINAVTKSGTNTLHGSAYYIFRNEDLAGKTPTGDKKLATKIPDFSNKTYGLTVGGPIIKNKLFYFISGEIQRDQTPLNFTFSDYNGTKDPALIQRLKDTIFARTGGFDVGGYLNNLSETKANRITSKFDWNINDKNKLSLSYRYTYGDRIVPLDVNNNSLRFETNGYRFPTTTHSASAELKSNIGTNMSNRLLLTFTNVEDDRAPLGGKLIPAVQIFDGPTASIYFGTESNSTFNYLKQSTYNLVDQFRFTLGKNNLVAGVEAELFDAYNSFIPNTAGNYRYDSIGAFFRNMAPNQYIVNYPLLGKDEQTSESGAKFKIFKGALFLNDEIRVNSNFTLNVGLRADYYKFPTTPTYERFTIDSALPKFAQYYDLKGAFPGKQPKIPLELSPRVGFTYQVPGENITVRGGFGLFAGRIPMVWPSAIYNYNGISQGGYTASSSQNAAARNNIKFRMTPYTAEEVGISLANAKGRVVLASEEYRMPKVFRSSLAFDKRFGKGWTATIEGIFTKNLTDIQYTNINILPPTLKMSTGPDTRTVYPSPVTIPIRSNGTNPYQEVYLISNAEGRLPYAYNFTFMVTKSTKTGFYMNVSYNYGESVVLNEAQSSTPNSQWASIETVNGRNSLVLTTSDNSPGHRILANVSKRFTYANKRAYTTVSLLYTGESGQPFSYVYPGNSPAVRDQSFQTSVDLIYIPTASELQAMTFQTATFSNVSYTDVQQKAAFEQYIGNDKYLRTHRGQFAERNGSRAPFSNILDLKLTQGFNLAFGKQTYAVEIGYSMFNFTNFLNRDWGRRYFVPFDNFGLVNFSYATGTTTPRYTFNPNTTKPESVYNRFNPTYTARWMSQLEFRVKF